MRDLMKKGLKPKISVPTASLPKLGMNERPDEEGIETSFSWSVSQSSF